MNDRCKNAVLDSTLLRLHRYYYKCCNKLLLTVYTFEVTVTGIHVNTAVKNGKLGLSETKLLKTYSNDILIHLHF